MSVDGTPLKKSPDRHAKYHDGVQEQRDRIRIILDAYDFDPNDRVTLPIVMWVMKAWEIADSMISLSKTQLEHSLYILLRPLMEYCTRAKYLSFDSEERLMRFLRKEASDELKLNSENTQYQSELKAALEYAGDGKYPPDFRGMLEAIEHGPLYVEYQRLSKYTHGSIHQIYESVMHKDHGSSQLVMLKEPTDDEKYLLWYITAYFLNVGAEALESRSVAD